MPIALWTIYEDSHSEKPEKFEVEVDIERNINNCTCQSFSNGCFGSHENLKWSKDSSGRHYTATKLPSQSALTILVLKNWVGWRTWKNWVSVGTWKNRVWKNRVWIFFIIIKKEKRQPSFFSFWLQIEKIWSRPWKNRVDATLYFWYQGADWLGDYLIHQRASNLY